MSIDFEALFPPIEEPPERRRPRARRWPWIAVALLLVGLALARALVGLYTDGLWFASLGQSAVLRLRVLAPLGLFLALFAAGALWLGLNGLIAARWARAQTAWPGQRAGRLAASLPGWVLLAALVVAALIAAALAGHWSEILLLRHARPFGTPEPLFGRDVGFYVFTLPVWRIAQAAIGLWVAAALAGTVLVYGLAGAIDLSGELVAPGRRGRGGRRARRRLGPGLFPALPDAVRRHLAFLSGLALLAVAAGQWLDRYDLLFVSRDGAAFFGPGYADATARLSGYGLAAGVWLLAGLACFLVAWRGRWMWALGLVALALGARLVLGEAWPAMVQRYRVEPDELNLERPYIQHNIDLTLAAFGLENVRSVDFTPAPRVTPAVLAAEQATLRNVRLWDWRVMLDFLEQKQSIRPYYRFLDVDVDRYPVEGERRQVELAARELDPDGLSNPSWINRHLEYTHGYGAVVAPVDEVDARGQPVLWAKDLPTQVVAPFDRAMAEPRIYFGEAGGGSYVIVGSRQDEFDYPAGEANARTRYAGADGVGVGSYLRRLAFALRFGDSEILLSDAITPASRILLYRDLGSRLRRLAPFLSYDGDPYLVIGEDGRLLWIQDAYTQSERFPYSQPVAMEDGGGRAGRASYIRNSVKAVVDALDGTVRLYVVDPEDPIIAAWRGVFPGLFRPQDEMPAWLQAHWRYPERLFRAQARVFGRYHVRQADVFYNAEDRWETPLEVRSQAESLPMQPYFVTMRLEGEAEPEFLLMLPYTPAGKKNMIAWLAARSDPAHYGQLVLYNFGKGTQIDGPEQVEARIDNSPDISAQLTLWSQAGTETIRGNLLVIPLGDTLLYVEPLYLQATANALPELKRVIVADAEGVAMRETLTTALQALVRATGDSAGAGEAGTGPISTDLDAGTAAERDGGTEAQPRAATPAAAMPEGAPAPGALDLETAPLPALAAAARREERLAQAALAAGDWAAFGRHMEALSQALAAIEARAGADTGSGEAP